MESIIGLAAVTYVDNYGSHLQTFATQEAIRRMGYNVEILNIDSVKAQVSVARRNYFLTHIVDLPALNSYRNLVEGKIAQRINTAYAEMVCARHASFKRFAQKHYLMAPIQDGWRGLAASCEEYAGVLVGSDQLWRPANIRGNFYTLNFVPNKIKKISYATSFGISSIPKSLENETRNFLNRINYISVREQSGASIIQTLTGRKAKVVCDPTMLLPRESWEKYISPCPVVEGKYILMYLLGANKKQRKFIRELRRRTGLKVVGILHGAWYVPGDEKIPDIVISAADPFEFLNIIKNAEYVCTDSYHGTVFSIIFNRKFFSFKRFSDNDRMSTNHRIITLLEACGTMNTLIENRELEKCETEIEMDYGYVNKKIETIRRDGYKFLSDSFAE